MEFEGLEDIKDKDWYDEKKPTFVFRIDCQGLSRQRAEHDIGNLIDEYKTENANIIFLPINSNGVSNESTSVECIHGGVKSDESELLKNVIENTLNLDDELIEEARKTKNFTEEQLMELKSIIRRRKIKALIGE